MRQSKCNWVRLGDYIEKSEIRNSDGKLNQDDVCGISIEKKIIPTKANLDGVDVSAYKVFQPDEFCFVTVTSRNGNKITLAMNDTDKSYLVSTIYVVFRIKDTSKLLPTYLYLYLSRPEFDRYSRTHSWGSAREYFWYADMCDVKIPLPSLEEQEKCVECWEALREIKEQNESIATPLMQVCQSYIQELKHEFKDKMVKIGPFMTKGVKNSDGKISKVLGVAQSGFIEPQKIPNPNLRNYKVMDKNAICYAPPLYNILSDAIQLYEDETPAICSPIYEVFYVNEKVINPAFLLMWLKRTEFKRYAEFYSMGVRNTFNYELMEQVEIPLPSLEKQNAIVNIFNCANEAKRIAEEADRKSREVCPALIQHVIHQSEKA